MRRNTISIIGSAGLIPCELGRTVGILSCALSKAGFDLVIGGMGGVMRGVARGHSRSAKATNLVHIEPGWGVLLGTGSAPGEYRLHEPLFNEEPFGDPLSGYCRLRVR